MAIAAVVAAVVVAAAARAVTSAGAWLSVLALALCCSTQAEQGGERVSLGFVFTGKQRSHFHKKVSPFIQ